MLEDWVCKAEKYLFYENAALAFYVEVRQISNFYQCPENTPLSWENQYNYIRFEPIYKNKVKEFIYFISPSPGLPHQGGGVLLPSPGGRD